MSRNRNIELLAPAKNEIIGIEAIKHGADAVYIGASAFGARSQACNDLDSIKRLVDFAHQYDARIYATVNTIIYNHELQEVEKLIKELYRAGVDALIVQDMGILRLNIPPIALHASTQCDLRTPEKAKFLESVGFSQLVLARELSLTEISSIREAVKVPLEGFCHGALCVSYSGRCQISHALKGRSANRGECAQYCRLSYDLEDSNGNQLLKSKHLLSLRDFNASDRLIQLIDAGISSFKIEGRLKDVDYVKNVVAFYRQSIDKIIASREDLKRSSSGNSDISFTPSLAKSFNRSFTHYFIDERHPANGFKMASIDTPKSQGEFIGKVTAVNGNIIHIGSSTPLVNGDGLSYMDNNGNYDGFRANKIVEDKVILKDPSNIRRGDIVYRTYDKAFNDILGKPSATRKIIVDFTLWNIGRQLCLKAADERGCSAVHSLILDSEPEKPLQPQHERQRQVLSKLGDTIYIMRECNIISDLFIPISVLANLRRETVELLERSHKLSRCRDLRKLENLNSKYPAKSLESQDNVANNLARRFFEEHGVESIVNALEYSKGIVKDDHAVMHTRYCLRRELGACLKDKKNAHKLPNPLFLRNGKTLLKVCCNCNRCEMTISIVSQ